MANYLGPLLLALVLLCVVESVSGSPVVTLPTPIFLPAGVPPSPPLQHTQVMAELCYECWNILEACRCQVSNYPENDAAYGQPPFDHLQDNLEPAPSHSSYSQSIEGDSAAAYSTYRLHHQPQPTSYYSTNPHSSQQYDQIITQSDLMGAWADTPYNPPDREHPRLGSYHSQARQEAMLDPVIKYLSSRPVSPNMSIFNEPAGIDSASIDPHLLVLPVKHRCPHCGKQFAPKSLQRHIQRQHNPHVAYYNCQYDGCPYSSAKQTDVDRHITSKHTDEKPYECQFCLKPFPRKDNKNRHEKQKHPEYFQ